MRERNQYMFEDRMPDRGNGGSVKDQQLSAQQLARETAQELAEAYKATGQPNVQLYSDGNGGYVVACGKKATEVTAGPRE